MRRRGAPGEQRRLRVRRRLPLAPRRRARGGGSPAARRSRCARPRPRLRGSRAPRPAAARCERVEQRVGRVQPTAVRRRLGRPRATRRQRFARATKDAAAVGEQADAIKQRKDLAAGQDREHDRQPLPLPPLADVGEPPRDGRGAAASSPVVGLSRKSSGAASSSVAMSRAASPPETPRARRPRAAVERVRGPSARARPSARGARAPRATRSTWRRGAPRQLEVLAYRQQRGQRVVLSRNRCFAARGPAGRRRPAGRAPPRATSPPTAPASSRPASTSSNDVCPRPTGPGARQLPPPSLSAAPTKPDTERSTGLARGGKPTRTESVTRDHASEGGRAVVAGPSPSAARRAARAHCRSGLAVVPPSPRRHPPSRHGAVVAFV